MTEHTAPGKTPYEKPELREIQLHADEVLSSSCKNSGQTGPGGADCVFGASDCSTIGS